MADILTQEEVDSLLTPLDEDKAKKEAVRLPDDIASLKAEVIELRILLQRYEKMKDDLRDTINIMELAMLVNDPIIESCDEVRLLLGQPTADLKIDLRLRQKLETHQCSTIGALCASSMCELRKFLTKAEVSRIVKALEKMGLYLVG